MRNENMKFKLLPYSETIKMEGSKKQPVFHIFINKKTRITVEPDVEESFKEFGSQLCYQCKECRGVGTPSSNEMSLDIDYTHPCSCQGNGYLLYKGEHTKEILELMKVEKPKRKTPRAQYRQYFKVQDTLTKYFDEI